MVKRRGWGFRIAGDLFSFVMVSLLEFSLFLDCRWDEEEDIEDSVACFLGDGEGVRVGEVFLEVVEVLDGGFLFVFSFCRKE